MYFRFFISWCYWPPIACNKSRVPALESKYSGAKWSLCGFSCFQALHVMTVSPGHRVGALFLLVWLELHEVLLIILMCFTWVFSETAFQKRLVCSMLLEHCAFSAWPWCAGVLVPLQLPIALVLSVML